MFEQISAIENQYNTAGATKIDQDDLIAVVLDCAPEKYQSILTIEQRTKGTALKMDDLQEAMNQMWRTSGKRETRGKGSEMTLGAFDGACYVCNEKGHRANECPTRKGKANPSGGGGSPKQKFTGKCNECGKIGHKLADCWTKNANADKHPKWYKKSEHGNAGIDSNESGGVEYMLNAITFPKLPNILKDPNVWIGDTGATVHMTPYEDGLTNLREATKDDGVTMGNNVTESTSKVGDMKAVMCNQHGQLGEAVIMKNVSVVPTSGFNLFSLTKMMNAGWTLHGNEDAILLTKGKMRLCFDIKVDTPQRAVYAMYIKRTEIPTAGIDEKKKKKQLKLRITQAHERLGCLLYTSPSPRDQRGSRMPSSA